MGNLHILSPMRRTCLQEGGFCATFVASSHTLSYSMKKILLSAAILCGSLASHAQFFEVGLHGGYGTTWLINNNVSDQDDILNYETSFASVFGVGFGYFSKSGAGIALEINAAPVRQKYEGSISAPLIGF